MTIATNENIIKVLNSYNPWWATGEIINNNSSPLKRFAYYEANEILKNKSIRRFIILSGARRVGKTTVLFQQIQDLLNNGIEPRNILYVSFDNPLLKFITINDIFEIYTLNVASSDSVYLFFDEIQYAQEWDKWLKILYDLYPNVKLVATGSASTIIEKGVTESGTGRWLNINVPTLSFYEYCKLLKADDNIKFDISKFNLDNLKEITNKELNQYALELSGLQKHFNRYIKIGGFPELVLSEDDTFARRILREDIIDKVLKRDIPSLYNVRNISVLEKVFLYLSFNSSNIINYTTMSKELENISLPTIQEYIRYLECANLIYISQPINTSGKELLKSKPKIYIVDSAIRNAVLMQDDILTDAKELGYAVETTVFRHLYNECNNYAQIGYLRDNRKGKEIDIVIEGIRNRIFVEVKYRENSSVKLDNPLYNVAKDGDCIVIVTKNSTDYGINEVNGKRVVRIPAFMLLYLIGNRFTF